MRTDTVEPGENILGHQLADMQEITWQQALQGEQTFLRLAHPSVTLLDALRERFTLDELYIKDICNAVHPPQFTRLEQGGLLIILRFPVELVSEDKNVDTTSVSILADDKMCVLIWPGRRFHFFANGDLSGLSVEECVCKIIHLLVDHLLRRVYTLREEMDEVEDACLADVDDADLGRLLLIRKEFAMLARQARNNEIAIDQLRSDALYRDNLRLIDAHEHMQRASAIAESRSEHALSVMQAVQSLLSQRLNEVMRLLAMITVILTPMGIIAGVFGMNFTEMGVLRNPHGFALSIGGMLLLALVLGVYFKIKRWW